MITKRLLAITFVLFSLTSPIRAFAQQHPHRGSVVHGGATPHSPSVPHGGMGDYTMMMRHLELEANYYDQHAAVRRGSTYRQAMRNQQSMAQSSGRSTDTPKHQAGQRQSSPSGQKSNSQATNQAGQKQSSLSDQKATTKKSHEEGTKNARHGEKGKTKEASNASTRKKPLMEDQGVVSLLRTVDMELRKMDHDYQGLRTQAIDHVTNALTSLGAQSSSLYANVHREARVRLRTQSDLIMQTAIGQLKSAETLLRNKDAAHHSQARISVVEAIHELSSALNTGQ